MRTGQTDLARFRLFFLPLLAILSVAGCKLEMENPVEGAEFTHGANVHFSVKYKNCLNCANRVEWSVQYTDEAGVEQDDPIGTGASFDYDALPLIGGEPTEVTVRCEDPREDLGNSDHWDERTVTILPGCWPTDCAELSQGCLEGYCDSATNSCATRPAADGSSCDDGQVCTVGDH